MAADNRRTEGQRPTHPGRNDRESNAVLEIRDEETIHLTQWLSDREARDWQRRREGKYLQLSGHAQLELNLWPAESLQPDQTFFAFRFGTRIRLAPIKARRRSR
jgi:hypothetical protein